MKKFKHFKAAISIALVAMTLQTASIAGAKTVTLVNTEKYKNEIRFVSEAPLEKISGTAEVISGSFNIDLQNLSATNGSFTVPVKSMATNSSSRDSHMFASEWLDEAKYKTITFTLKSLSVDNTESGVARTVVNATAKGEFTLHGVTKSLDAKVKITYLPESAQTKQVASGDLVLVQVEFLVPLKAHGIFGKGGMVGSKVGENIAINAQLFGATGAR